MATGWAVEVMCVEASLSPSATLREAWGVRAAWPSHLGLCFQVYWSDRRAGVAEGLSRAPPALVEDSGDSMPLHGHSLGF